MNKIIEVLNDETGIIEYYPGYFSAFNRVLDAYSSFNLEQKSIKFFGKEIIQPRLVSFMGDKGVQYKYSGVSMIAKHWSQEIELIKKGLNQTVNQKFNSCLLNYYRNGYDSMGLHADNEKELGVNPIIASVSFGTTRRMVFRKIGTKEIIKIDLNDGDLLVMRGALQHNWKHELPKQRMVSTARLNLTFRKVY